MYNPAQTTGIYRPSEGTGLIWTEYLYLIAAAIAATIVVDPLGMGLNFNSQVKHLPLLLTIPAFVLTLTGRRLNEVGAKPIVPRVLAVAWPFALLALFIVAGSIYLRVLGGVRETLLNIGLYMTLLFVAASMVLASKAPEKLIRAYFSILLVAALIMSAMLIVSYGSAAVYHEEIFLVIPMAVYCGLVLKNPWLRVGGVIVFLSMAVFSLKNTGYLVALMSFFYLGYGFWLPRLRRADSLNRLSGYYIIFVIVLLVAAGVMFLLAFRETYLPSGNTQFRLHTYEIAWDRFLDSPIWGRAFADRAVDEFTLYQMANTILPTHSDIMDLLANGGLIAIALWLLGLILVARAGNRTLLTPSTYDHPWTPYAHTLAVLSLAGIIVYAFNPILVQPGMSYCLWTNLGLLLGLALRPEAIRAHGSPQYRPLGRYEFRVYKREPS